MCSCRACSRALPRLKPWATGGWQNWGRRRFAAIRSAGGGAANGVWTAIRLNKLGVPALASASEHAAMGTARLAWRGIGHDA